MIRIFIEPSTFEILPIQDGQNPYIDIQANHSNTTIQSQHTHVVNAFTASPTVMCNLEHVRCPLPDIVFCANAGLSLPRLGRPLLLLPNMKYNQRRDELSYLQKSFTSIQLPTMDYPGHEVFEGQAELKWFYGGRKAICGYGHRSTKKTFVELDQLFKKLYGKNNPELLVVRLISPYYYHLDVAMLEYDDTKCIVHRRSISPASLRKIERFLGKDNVTVLDTADSFCLNAVVDGAHLITHKLTDPQLQSKLESITGLIVKQVDTSEFETSGGSVRCMTLDIHSGV
jgi:N-dimethylarginine dimethylaminohydrolase